MNAKGVHADDGQAAWRHLPQETMMAVPTSNSSDGSMPAATPAMQLPGQVSQDRRHSNSDSDEAEDVDEEEEHVETEDERNARIRAKQRRYKKWKLKRDKMVAKQEKARQDAPRVDAKALEDSLKQSLEVSQPTYAPLFLHFPLTFPGLCCRSNASTSLAK